MKWIFVLMLVIANSAFASCYDIKMANPFVGAIIPTLGFTLSTFSLDFIKEFWKKF